MAIEILAEDNGLIGDPSLCGSLGDFAKQCFLLPVDGRMAEP